MKDKKENVSNLSDKRKEKAKVREGSPVKVTNSELRDIVNYGGIPDEDSKFVPNPYSRLMSSYEISPRLMNRCQHLVHKVKKAVGDLEENRKKLLDKYCERDKKEELVMLPNEGEVDIRLVKHFAKLAEADKDTNVTNIVLKKDTDKVREQIIKSLPPAFWSYTFEAGKEEEFNDALNKLLAEDVTWEAQKKIVIVAEDLPDQFLNAFERSLLTPLFEFDDLEEGGK